MGYAMSFASFLLDSKIADKINKIILFGSVARGDFDEESDVDLFVDTHEDIEKEVDKLLSLFRMSSVYEIWKLKGVANEITVKVGNLREWSLRREVISSGILLYGKYNEMPEKICYYMLVKMSLKGIRPSMQMSIWRKLYGYRQKVGSKVYTGMGLVEKLRGKKLGKAVILIPMENREQILGFLKQNKISYTVDELWSDTL